LSNFKENIMSDQVVEQSPQSRLEAMLGDDIVSDVQPTEAPEEKEEAPLEAKAEATEEVESEEATEEPEAEAEEVEQSDEDEVPAILKLKVNGEEVEKPIDEIVALAQQGLDYTQKTQQVAEQRKELEAYAESIKAQEQAFQEQMQLNNVLIEDVAKITSLDQQLNQYANVNWQQLSDNDFVEAQKLFFTYNQLQQERSQLVSQFEAKKQEVVTKQTQLMAEKIAKGKEILAKEIPNWSPETNQALLSTGKDYGFSDAELNAIVDPRHVKVLHDAMQWRKLQQNSTVKKKVSSAKPVVKPGAKDTKAEANSNHRQLRDQLRKTGKSDMAAKLIENML
jgi:FtsZ-binding cell division protein ZapB